MAERDKANGTVKEEGGRLFRLSVRGLVTFLLRSGDLPSSLGAADPNAMQAGSRLHRRIQARMGAGYSAEERIAFPKSGEGYELLVEGRADGIFSMREEAFDEKCALTYAGVPEIEKILGLGLCKAGAGERAVTVIDEIKGTYASLRSLEAPVPWQLGQAKFYAAAYALKHGLERVGVRMVYAELGGEERLTDGAKCFCYSFSREEITKWLDGLLAEADKWIKRRIEWDRQRDGSIGKLEFPFEYRPGQKRLVGAIYRTIESRGKLLCMAPTGTGKTMAAVYPAVWALRLKKAAGIFYLTAKNQTAEAADSAFEILRGRGARLKYVKIAGRERMCPWHKEACTAESCPLAKGFYDRINECLWKALHERDVFGGDEVLKIAEEAELCPYALARELAPFADAVCGDYNYAFDPHARIESFFSGKGEDGKILLVDEAHNLVDRAREMYSAELSDSEIMEAAGYFKDGGYKAEKKALKRLRQALLDIGEAAFEGGFGVRRFDGERYCVLAGIRREDRRPYSRELLEELEKAAARALSELDGFFAGEPPEKMADALRPFYFALGDFADVIGRAEAGRCVFAVKDVKGRVRVKSLCADPAARLKECLEGAAGTVFFSATLLPVSYYKRLLTGSPKTPAVYAESSFDPKRRLVLIGRGVTTRYRDRSEEMYWKIARYIKEASSGKKGNYMAFFPSFSMLSEVLEIYRSEFDDDESDYVAQQPHMDEAAREIFMENFEGEPRRTLVAFCVMGGIFSEGIDLKGDRLIGAVIVGQGIPQVTPEREVLREYFQRNFGSGYSFAYLVPGMNKVLQAGGRVIRTAEDRGVVMLLDDRFLEEESLAMLPREWGDWRAAGPGEAGEAVKEFFKEEPQAQRPED